MHESITLQFPCYPVQGSLCGIAPRSHLPAFSRLPQAAMKSHAVDTTSVGAEIRLQLLLALKHPHWSDSQSAGLTLNADSHITKLSPQSQSTQFLHPQHASAKAAGHAGVSPRLPVSLALSSLELVAPEASARLRDLERSLSRLALLYYSSPVTKATPLSASLLATKNLYVTRVRSCGCMLSDLNEEERDSR